ncbi:MAG: hypothetical protein V5A43_04785 [Haloarculaceae archaeon]
MNDRLRGTVWFVAAQLVFVTALLHLALGLWNWLRWIDAGFLLPQDLRWPAFVATALVVYYGLHRALHADDRKPYYLAGIVVMLGYAVGYFAWHIGGHPVLLVPGTGGVGTEKVGIQWFLDHLLAGPAEFFSVAVEVLAAVLLGVLYVTEPASDEEGANGAEFEEGVDGDSAGGSGDHAIDTEEL